jgi:MobA-like NTP transferase domain
MSIVTSSTNTSLNATIRALPPLVLLAAGIGRRYGGVKPLAPVGPGGMPLLLVELHQAASAGFTEAVVVIGATTGDAIKKALGEAELPMAVSFVTQEGFGPPRAKPWGTVPAVLAGMPLTGGLVVNGDDLYGAEGFETAAEWSRSQRTDKGDAALVAYRLRRTVSENGSVNRGLVEANGPHLVGLRENHEVHHHGDGFASNETPHIAADALVSMNLWVFGPSIVSRLHDAFSTFLAESGDDAGAECLLPNVIGELVTSGTIRVDVIETRAQWHGVTYADDVPIVRAALEQAAARDADR